MLKKPLIILSWILVWQNFTWSNSYFQLNEQALKQLAQEGAPQLEQIQSVMLGADLKHHQLQEMYAPELFGRAQYGETNEKPLIAFIPIWSPVKQAQLGVRQNLKHGFSAEAAVGTDQRSAVSATGKYRDITTTALSFTLQMDLWRDLFGRTAKAQLQSVEMESKRAALEKEIQNKAFLLTLRRIYWSLVANQESLKISEELLKTAEQQLEESQRRFKDSVAETDEVARNEAQVSSRKANLLYLTYQKENYMRQLKTLLPNLASKELRLDKYDLSGTFDQVMACTSTIAQEVQVPYQYTAYDEMVNALKNIKIEARKANQRYADPDLKFYGTVKTTGVGSDTSNATLFRGSYGASVDDIRQTNRSGYEVGLRLTVPLGEVKQATQRTRELYDDKRLIAAIQSSESQVINTHLQLLKSVQLLNDVIKNQSQTSRQLERRLVYMKKKYLQARVSLNDLILDQDALLRSELNTIETQLQVLYLLFDYFTVFTETPCAFNRI